MKKLIPIILVMFLMTGCCLSHDWTEADCTTAKTCAKCGETEGEALGHSWVDATCTEARTCTVCGVTEGEALGHILGNWEETADSAVRQCTGCDLTETMPLEEWKATQFIVGKWEGFAVAFSDNYYHEVYDPGPDYEFSITFCEDGTFTQECSLYTETHQEGTWEFVAMEDIPAPISYNFALSHQDGNTSGFVNAGFPLSIFRLECVDVESIDETQIALTIPFGDENAMVFHKKVS